MSKVERKLLAEMLSLLLIRRPEEYDQQYGDRLRAFREFAREFVALEDEEVIK